MKITLLFLSKTKYGGWVTYTSHLYNTLLAQGHEVDIVKITARLNPYPKDFGYGLTYMQYDIETLRELCADRAIVIIGIEKEYLEIGRVLLKMKNTSIVFHDPRSTRYVPYIPEWGERIISIRKNNLRYVPEATFIGHPYIRNTSVDKPAKRSVHARSISRIDFDKNIDIMLDANRMLPQDKQILINGFENRMYSHFNIMPKYPEWKQGVHAFTADADEAFRMMTETKYLVDISSIKGDGGGTQYTFLEAMDAGSLCLISDLWFRNVTLESSEIIPSRHCVSFNPTAECLVDLLTREIYGADDIIENAKKEILYNHSAEVLGPLYSAFISRLG